MIHRINSHYFSADTETQTLKELIQRNITGIILPADARRRQDKPGKGCTGQKKIPAKSLFLIPHLMNPYLT